jgi:hypothetical protein
MAYKQGMNKKPKKKSKKKIPPQQNNVNFFNNKKNSVDAVANSINVQYLSPFFSSRDGRPSTILKNHGPSHLNINMNSAIDLLQYKNMVTVDSVKAKKASKKVIPLKDRLSKSKRKDTSKRSTKNDSSSAGNRISEAYQKERQGYAKLQERVGKLELFMIYNRY